MKTKPRLSFWQIWNMSFGFLGIQFGFALQNANVSRIFQTLGADIDKIPILWIAAPVSGLIIQPIIGHFSDNTWTRFGRRRPYFLFGAIFASLALFLMPNSSALWIAAGMLWIMDASINISMEPFRAYVGDMLPEEQRTKGFAMQSFFIGTGAVVASILPYLLTEVLGFKNTAPEGVIPDSVKWSFYIGAAAYISSVLITVIFSKEYSPEQMKEFNSITENSEDILLSDSSNYAPNKSFFNLSAIFGLFGISVLTLVYFFSLEKELYVLAGILLLFSLLMIISWWMRKYRQSKNGMVEILSDLIKMPSTMKQLAIVQFFTWIGLFALWMYMTNAVTESVYGTTDTKSELYNIGANWVGILFGVYNGVAALVAFLLPYLARKTSRKTVHLSCLIIGGVSLMSIFLIKNHYLLIVPMVGVGIAWASILSMPYAMLTTAIPNHKMGIYMGIFNFFVVLPQILATTIFGAMMNHFFGNQSIYVLVFGGVCMILGGLATIFVKDK